jgi:hypothetical protein
MVLFTYVTDTLNSIKLKSVYSITAIIVYSSLIKQKKTNKSYVIIVTCDEYDKERNRSREYSNLKESQVPV